MLTVLREKRIELAKMLAMILVFAGFSTWELPGEYLPNETLKLLIDAVAAFLVVFFVADILLGRPTVKIEWRTNSQNRPAIEEIVIGTKRQSINLQVKVEGASALQRILLRRSQRNQFIINIQMYPTGAVKLIRQTGPGDFKRGADRESLIFEKVLIDANGAVAFADFTVKRRATEGYEHTVRIDVTARWIPPICRMPVTLAKVESGVERLILEG